MATFTALNVEPDDNFEDDIDNTREIQIEEALKLYQTALKLHSQGPRFYDEAATAYEDLLKSDIFKYPESVTDFTRFYEHPELEFEPDLTSAIEAELPLVGSDGSPSSLPQVLYLTYKNYGQFIMDRLRQKIRSGEETEEGELTSMAQLALDQFAQALVRDESDTELWRRSARIALTLGSNSIARYCLEAAVEVDDDPTLNEVDPVGPEEGFAGVQLKEHLEVLSDEVALTHPIMAPYEKKHMNERLRKYMDPYPFLEKLPLKRKDKPEDLPASDRAVIKVPQRTWLSLGESILEAASSGTVGAAGISIELAEDTEMIESVETAVPKAEPVAETPIEEAAPSLVSTIPIRSNPDNEMNSASPEKDPKAPDTEANGDQESPVNTRKRSQSTAGIQENADEENGTTKRSKRIRKRDASIVDSTPIDPKALYQEQLNEYSDGDAHMFTYINSLLDKLAVNNLGSFEDVQQAIAAEMQSNPDTDLKNAAIRDLQLIMKSWDEAKMKAFASGNGIDILGTSGGGPKAGISSFLEHSKSGQQKLASLESLEYTPALPEFIATISDGWFLLEEVAYGFFKAIRESYGENLWSEDLKRVVIQLMTSFDSSIFSQFQDEVKMARVDGAEAEGWAILEEFGQMMFELHLDLYSSITNPSSVVGYTVRVEQKDSLGRWAMLTSDLIHGGVGDEKDELLLRYAWASVLYASMAEGSDREHVILCWKDIQGMLKEHGDPRIELQNNVAMPEVSAAAADREISRLATMDFFLTLFKTDNSDPATIIETLEPVLEPQSVQLSSSDKVLGGDDGGETTDDSSGVSAVLRDMWKFLETGSISLRLFLWQRLREAYKKINYTTKEFSCYLKSIEIIVDDIHSARYTEVPADARYNTLLSSLKTLDDLLVKALTLALNDQTAFEIIDMEHIKSTGSKLAKLCRLLHSTTLFDDTIRVGMAQLPRTASYGSSGSFQTFLLRTREMQVRSWALLYTMIKDGMSQNKELFPAMDSDLADYLAAVHYTLGLRKVCRVSNKIFLKMMKVELVRLKHVEQMEFILGQVLFDLFGIKLGSGVYELQDHGCPTENLDRRTAMTISDQVILLANRMSMKDLLKADLRATIEKMQQAIGPAKSNFQMYYNLRNYTEYLKTSISPLNLYRALKGQVYVDALPVTSHESPLADKGWYFLLGNISLSKFKLQKRTGPGATDDLKVAASFFRIQLQFTSEMWETWYRLAQCFDAELEEDVMWTSDKLNGDRTSLITLQRSAIHCYIMAISTAIRTADANFETASKISDMYYDFGFRIYSSSREPFGMQAFYLDDFERHFSGKQGMYKKHAHEELTRFKAWRYAATLFRKALIEKPSSWIIHYMLGKCLWKMYTRVDELDPIARNNRPSMESVIATFTKAIEEVPKPRDSRSEPIIEPHYKIISIIHKLVLRGDLQFQAAADILQRQPYALRKGEAVTINDAAEWTTYILECLRHLRNIDKSNWQHRMIARAASILFDEANPTTEAAIATQTELCKTMFTRTMVVQVWKPEYERPGRHCVYMEKYVRLMVKLLVMLNDKPNLEALAKRLRKRGADYYHFNEVWTDCCSAYCRLLRRSGDIPANQDEAMKSIPIEEFNVIADELQKWAEDPSASHPTLDCLKEAQELKKLNSNLMKSMPIDDLISDAYACLILQVGVNLAKPEPPAPPVPSASVGPSTLQGQPVSSGQQEQQPQPQPQPQPQTAPSALGGCPALQAPSTANGDLQPEGPMSLNNLISSIDGAVTIISTPATEDPTRAKPRGLTRREVLRRAEAVASRVPESIRTTATGNRARASDASLQPSGERATEGDGEANMEGVKEVINEGEENPESSPPGSVHDSADDESDLSDVPDVDEEEAVVMFPNLGKSEAPVESEADNTAENTAENTAGNTPAASGEAS